MWGYVLNLVNDGKLLGAGTSQVLSRGSPSYPGSVANAFDLAYSLMDLSVISNRQIALLATGGVLAAAAAGAWGYRRGRGARAVGSNRHGRDSCRRVVFSIAPRWILSQG